MIRNNQNGRRRGRGGGAPRPQQGTGGGNYGNNGSRIDNRQRGNATQLLEKYKAMARDATQNGDRVQAEFYMQYADHYFRVLSEFRARDPQPAQRPAYDEDDDGYGVGPGQNYAAGGDRYDDGDDDRGPAEPNAAGVNGGGNGGERPAYRANGERPQGGYPAPARGDRFDDRDQRPRYSRDGDDGRSDPARADGDGQRRGTEFDPARGDGQRSDGNGQRRDGHGDAMRRDGARGEAWRGDGARADNSRGDGARGEYARADNGRGDAVRAEGGRSDGVRRDGGRPRDWDGNRRDAAPRDTTFREAPREMPPVDETAGLIGLPGPATLIAATAPPPAEAFPAEVPATDPAAGDAPAPRRRGRPRKVVAVDTVEG